MNILLGTTRPYVQPEKHLIPVQSTAPILGGANIDKFYWDFLRQKKSKSIGSWDDKHIIFTTGDPVICKDGINLDKTNPLVFTILNNEDLDMYPTPGDYYKSHSMYGVANQYWNGMGQLEQTPVIGGDFQLTRGYIGSTASKHDEICCVIDVRYSDTDKEGWKHLIKTNSWEKDGKMPIGRIGFGFVSWNDVLQCLKERQISKTAVEEFKDLIAKLTLKYLGGGDHIILGKAMKDKNKDFETYIQKGTERDDWFAYLYQTYEKKVSALLEDDLRTVLFLPVDQTMIKMICEGNIGKIEKSSTFIALKNNVISTRGQHVEEIFDPDAMKFRLTYLVPARNRMVMTFRKWVQAKLIHDATYGSHPSALFLT